MMKRFISMLLALALCASVLTGCGSKSEQNSTAAAGSTASESGSEAVQETAVSYDYNLLTGKDRASDLPANQRPVAIMVNNIQACLPQTGISSADVIYEMETEGGITRMMAVFSDYTKVPLIGPVRSARDQFVQFVLPLNAIYVHIGSSTYASDMLNYYSYQDVDGMYLGTTAFVFDEERYKTKASEHCWYTSASLIQSGMSAVGNIPTTGTLSPLFKFASNGSKVKFDDAADTISFRFSSYGDAAFTYDSSTGTYLKSIYGAAQMDEGTGTQLAFNNVFVLYCVVGHKPDTELTDFDLYKGEGFYFTNGTYTPVTWTKDGDEAQMKIWDSDGKEMTVSTGKSYIAMVATDEVGTLAVNGSLLYPEETAESSSGSSVN